MSSTKIITGLFVGILVGILIAPDKGSATRKKLSKSVNDLSDHIQDIIETARGEANDLADEGIESVENAESQINEALI
jgi:gas vesicle protein